MHGPGKGHKFPTLNARYLSRTLQEHCHKWPILGWAHPQNSQTNSRALLSGFHFGFPLRIPTLIKNVTLLFHPLKSNLSVHCMSFGEYDIPN